MILQALTRYYDILAKDPDTGISQPGYSIAKVNFSLSLSTSGELLDIFPLFKLEKKGRKIVESPILMTVPEQEKRQGNTPFPYFLCDTSEYVLGIPSINMRIPEDAIKRFEAFKDMHIGLLQKANCISSKALISFLESYSPEQAQENPIILRYWDEFLKKANLVFSVEGLGYIHEDIEIRKKWEVFHDKDVENIYIGQCLITGQNKPIARLHGNIKGLYNSKTQGPIVSFKNDAYQSYGKMQGLNSPISKDAAFAYTTVLNYLLSNGNQKFSVGDSTVIYWAESPNQDYADFFSNLFQIGWDDEESQTAEEGFVQDKKAENRLAEIGKKVRCGDILDAEAISEGLNPETQFYILGLAPNAGRVSIRFFHQDPFIKIIQKIIWHYQDLQIIKEFDDQPTWIPLYRLLGETYSKKSSDKKAAPLLAGAVLQSILEGSPYPAALYYAVINRIRADMDDKSKQIQKINYFRAAIIKAYLVRKNRTQNNSKIQEVLCMSLNKQSTYPAYLLGRLFAVLEKAQKEAIPNLNATIKDRYFTTACASPASVFPILLRLSQHHLSKIEKSTWLEMLVEEIMNKLDINDNPIPSHLSLDDQGVFIIGYYHQHADFYLKKTGALDQIENKKNGEDNE